MNCVVFSSLSIRWSTSWRFEDSVKSEVVGIDVPYSKGNRECRPDEKVDCLLSARAWSRVQRDEVKLKTDSSRTIRNAQAHPIDRGGAPHCPHIRLLTMSRNHDLMELIVRKRIA